MDINVKLFHVLPHLTSIKTDVFTEDRINALMDISGMERLVFFIFHHALQELNGKTQIVNQLVFVKTDII